jgi:4-hydroxy-2-oxoheptanedioate aldolase
MDNLIEKLIELKAQGCVAIKISFEDEGALLNEIMSMRYLTAQTGLKLSIKIGGCEAKRDIMDCIDLCADTIVSPMIETNFALKKFIESTEKCNYNGKKGVNIETIQGYENHKSIIASGGIDFITFGRVDFVSSIGKNRDFVEDEEIYKIIKTVFYETKQNNIKCYLGGAIGINTKNNISKLKEDNLIDCFETRYVIFDINLINMDKYDELIYNANYFELEWMKYIQTRYSKNANKDASRIDMIQNRLRK